MKSIIIYTLSLSAISHSVIITPSTNNDPFAIVDQPNDPRTGGPYTKQVDDYWQMYQDYDNAKFLKDWYVYITHHYMHIKFHINIQKREVT